jgi:type VI protein secretion system component VasK
MTGWQEVVNIIVSVAALWTLVSVCYIAWFTRARWTYVMAFAYVWLLAVRICIIFEVPWAVDHSRQLVVVNTVLVAGAFFWFAMTLRKFYKNAHDKHMQDIADEEERVARELEADARDVRADAREEMSDRREAQSKYEEGHNYKGM